MTNIADPGVAVPLGTGRSLSAMQRSLWVSQLNHPDAPVQNMPLLSLLDGPIDAERLAAAFDAVAAGSDALRTRLVEGTGPAAGQWQVELIPAGELPPTEIVEVGRSDVEAWARARGAIPLAMTAVGYDSAIAVHEDRTVSWYLNLHHVITDATSSALVFHAAAARYDAQASPSTDPGAEDPDPSYYKWARTLAANLADPADAATGRAIEHWRSREPAPRIGRLYRQVDAPTPEAQRLPLPLGPELLRRAEDRLSGDYRMLTPDLGWTTVLMTATAVYCHRLTGATEFAVGLPVHNRSDPTARELIGPTMEVFPVDIRVELDDTFRAMHKRVGRAILATLRHAAPGTSPAADYEAVVNVIPRADQQRFGSIEANTRWLHTCSIDSSHLLRVQMTGYGQSEETADGEATLGPEFALDLNHGGADGDHRGRAAGHFLTVVSDLVTDPDLPIGHRTLCGPDELDALRSWESPARIEVGGPAVIDRLAATLAGNDAIVIEDTAIEETADQDTVLKESGRDGEPRALSGAELWAWIAAVAVQLRADGIEPGDRVGVDLPRSIEAVVSIAAVMALGGSFVPLDPSQPVDRRRTLAERAGCARVLSSPGEIARLRPESPASGPDLVITPRAGSDEVYLLFTSGSTGQPKGVPITVSGLADYIRFAEMSYTGSGPGPIAPLFSPLTFDLTITSLFMPILTGGQLVVIEADGPAGLSAIARRPDLTWCKATPSHLEILVRLLPADHGLATVVVGGEAFGTRLAADLLRFNPDLRIFNEYGPTEAVVGCMRYEVEAELLDRQSEVPIGEPAPGVTLLVVDDHLQRVPLGAGGELCIAHDGLTAGYLGGDSNTGEPIPGNSNTGESNTGESNTGESNLRATEPFVEIEGRRFYRSGDLVRLQDGRRLVYLGRKDEQVKVGGIRLEPMEVEDRLDAHPAVARSAVRLWSPSYVEPTGHCVRCGLPDNVPGVRFDDAGVCHSCHAYDRVAPIAESWFRTPDDLRAKLAQVRAAATGDYHCLHLLSGGKDSTYALYQLVELGFRPYVLTLDNGFISEGALENVRRSVVDLGLDHEFATVEAMNAIFRDSLDRYSNVCHGCYKTIYTLATTRAAEIGAPLIVTGLSRGQLFETRLIPQQFSADRFDPDAIDRAVLEARKIYHRVDDGPNRLLDTGVFADDEIFDRIEYLDFYRYVDVELAEMLDFLDRRAPWVRPSDTGRSTNCLINAAGIHTHQTEQGYHNYAVPYAWDVRLGHKTRDEAIEELDDRSDLDEVDQMLQAVGYRPRPREVLTAWIEPAPDIERLPHPTELRSFLAETLPAHAIPSAFVDVDQLAMSANGKLDLRALPAPERVHRPGPTLQLSTRPETERPPMSDLERSIVELWERILQIEPVGVDDDFFALGGDSLAALEMIVGLGDLQGRHLSEDLAFTHTTPSDLARALAIDEPAGEPATKLDPADFATPEGQPPSRSAGELAVLFDQAGRPDDIMYNVGRLYLVQGPVDPDRFEAALRAVAARHQPLTWSHGTTRRPLRSDQALSFVSSPDPVTAAELERRATEAHRTPFDLENGPLLRAMVQPVDDGTTALVLAIHHASGDAAGFTTLLEQINRELAGSDPSVEALDYAGFSAWQEAALSDADRDHWLASSGSLAPAALSVHRPNPPQPDGFVTRRSSVTVSRLRSGSGASPAAMAVASVAAAVRHFSDGPEVELGLITSTRNHPRAQPLFGYFLNTVPVRLPCDRRQTVAELAAGTGTTIGKALAHRSYPLARIAADRADQGRPAPSLDVLVAFDELHDVAVDGAPTRQRVLSNGSAVAPLTFFVELRGDDVELSVEHRGSAVGRAEAALMLETVDRALAAMVDRPDATIDETGPAQDQLSLLIGDEQADLTPIPTRIERHLQAAGSAPAVSCGDDRLTWHELNRRSAAIARSLETAGVASGDRVVLCLPRSVDLVAAIVGIHRVGAAYVPIDPGYPDDRIELIVRGAEASVGLVDDDHRGLVERPITIDGSGLDRQPWPGPGDRGPEPAARSLMAEPDGPAYVIFTSGSTGEPRGVEVSHRNLAASTNARSAIYPAEPSRFLLVSSVAFDSSIVGLFWTLAAGGTVVLPTEAEVHDLAALEALLQSGVSHTLMVPTLYQGLLDLARRRGEADGEQDWAGHVIVAGEACPPSLLDGHFDLFPDAALTNEYGPTEASVWATAHRCAPGDDPVPIGPPIPGAWVAVAEAGASEAGPILPRGVEGELVIGGLGVVDGYTTGPAPDRFSALGPEDRPPMLAHHPSIGDGRIFRTGDRAVIIDGQVRYLGRGDNQLNLGGARAEPEEIENVLLSVDGVTAAVVVAVDTRPLAQLLETVPADVIGPAMARSATDPDPAESLRRKLAGHGPSQAKLVAHIEADATVETDQLRAAATAALPQLLRPAVYRVHEALPTTPNGKLDRSAAKALPIATIEGPPAAPMVDVGADPADETESDRADELTGELCRLFADSLKLDRVEPDAGFFDHGGHSLLAMELLLTIEDRYRCRLSATTLYSAPTPRELAIRLADEIGDETRSFLVPIQPDGDLAPIFAVHVLGVDCAFFRPLAARLGPDQPMFGLGQPTAEPNTTGPTEVVEVARAYAEEIEAIHPTGPLSLMAISLGGVVAYELAQQLTSQGRDVTLLSLFDAFGPEAAEGAPGLAERLAAHRQRAGADPGQYLADQLDLQGQRLRRSRERLSLAVRDRLRATTDHQLEVRRFIESNIASQVAYTYDPYPAPMLVIKAGEDPFAEPHVDNRMGWGSVAVGGIQIDVAPGKHLSIMEEPNVEAVAASVQRELARHRPVGRSGDGAGTGRMDRITAERMLTGALRLGRLPAMVARLQGRGGLDDDAVGLLTDVDRVLVDLGRATEDVATAAAEALTRAGLIATVVPVPTRLQHATATIDLDGNLGSNVEEATEVMASLDLLPVDRPSVASRTASVRATGHLDYIGRGVASSRIRLRWGQDQRSAGRGRQLARRLAPTSRDLERVELPPWAWPGYWPLRALRTSSDRLRSLLPQGVPGAGSGDAGTDRSTKNLGIYLGTPPGLIDPLLRFAQIQPGEAIVDLGCGDGRVLIEAARRFGCRARGYEIDRDLVDRARAAATEAGVDQLVEVVHGDAMDPSSASTVAQADLVFAFLPPQAVSTLLEPTLQLLGPEARFLSHEQLAASLPVEPDRTGLVVGLGRERGQGGITVANLWTGTATL